ncbi:MAG: ATP-dependent Clp protease adapter ClpS [Spirochaetota bacterium]|jgi:ATP-dependent Clp protease adaptor protein ClpS
MAHTFDNQGDLQVKKDIKVKKPRMYKVILHNDHYTTMDFVVEVLVKIFHKNIMEATELMLQVHRNGFGICGVYTYDIAQTKANQVHSLARQREFPLKCTVEEA